MIVLLGLKLSMGFRVPPRSRLKFIVFWHCRPIRSGLIAPYDWTTSRPVPLTAINSSRTIEPIL